jgi:hypothetical protein
MKAMMFASIAFMVTTFVMAQQDGRLNMFRNHKIVKDTARKR